MTLDQRRESLDPATTLAEALTGGPGGGRSGDTVFVGGTTPRHVIGYMKDFLFLPEQARTPVGALSGGERGRLVLARAFAAPSNLMVLDEPTNDLDLETLDLLVERLAEYKGTVLVVSHDRDLLDRVATSVIAWEGEGGRWQDYAGGYSDMVAQRGRGVEAKAAAAPGGASRSAAAAAPKVAAPKVAAPKPPPAPARPRLSFKEKHALETLPARIDALHAEAARLREVLSDPGLYARDRAGFERRSAALVKAEAALAAAEEEWLALEMRREAIEAGAGAAPATAAPGASQP